MGAALISTPGAKYKLGLQTAVSNAARKEDSSRLGALLVSTTAMPVVLFAAQAPERVDALVLLSPLAQGPRNEGFDANAGLSPCNDRTNRKIMRLHSNPELSSLRIARNRRTAVRMW